MILFGEQFLVKSVKGNELLSQWTRFGKTSANLKQNQKQSSCVREILEMITLLNQLHPRPDVVVINRGNPTRA